MTKKFFIYDNFLPETHANIIEKVFASDNNVPYYFHPTSCGEYDNPYYELYTKNKEMIVEAPQFTHYFYDENHKKINSDYINYPCIILNTFKDKFNDINFHVIRMKANMQLQNKKSSENHTAMPHRDFDFEHVVLLYYVNDSDGDTILFEDTTDKLKIAHRIQPKKNRLLVFDGNWLHSSSVPIKSEYRVVFNYDIEVFER